MRCKLCLLAIAGVLSCDAPGVSAHHSFASTYRENEVIAIEGDLVEIIRRHPHSYLHVKAPDGGRRMRVWAVECGSLSQIRLQTLIEQTLRPGDHVVVTGSPGRDAGAWRLRLRTIVRPRDGWRWSDAVNDQS